MYPEFIAIYIGLAVLILMQAAVLVLLIKVNRSLTGNGSAKKYGKKSKEDSRQQSTSYGVVFCRNCGTRYDASMGVCPKCGTPR